VHAAAEDTAVVVELRHAPEGDLEGRSDEISIEMRRDMAGGQARSCRRSCAHRWQVEQWWPSAGRLASSRFGRLGLRFRTFEVQLLPPLLLLLLLALLALLPLLLLSLLLLLLLLLALLPPPPPPLLLLLLAA